MSKPRALLEILAVSAKLGVTSFGGPIAHLGYFHNEYIRRRKWLNEQDYADIVALCQFLPGPASSQVGIAVGIVRAGMLGGLTAWLGFTLPSVIALVLFALLLQGFDIGSTGWIHGLKIVAVAIVVQAILGMGQKLAPDRNRATIAVLVAAVTVLWQTAISQVLLIGIAGIVGMFLYKNSPTSNTTSLSIPISRNVAMLSLGVFFGLLILPPSLRQMVHVQWLSMFDSFYRSGSLVFGGGHVVLPMLEREVVPTGWVSKSDFLAGYGAAQAVPGPLFTFAAYLGTMIGGVKGAIIATTAIFLPAYLLVVGALPFWHTLRKSAKVQGAIVGINAAVVGILLAALYNPLWITAILAPVDFVLAMILFVMLVFWKLPPWVVVIAGALGGMLIS
ncbi:chromate transporter [Paenibacillus sp. CGMCC 1.16610]|uniref:Chromate efflux transporter n=1 Tax=Paenibacillus anseongense TaxID=2682845 RepID=A0ABW9UKG1_9BACL|nr:chromate transporter [Paenibacillus sp. CGMCC 1.16610]MVQ39757.1 chromate efflux transporter [Paenibacillus anseongense]